MIDWDYERSRCAFPSDDPPEAAAAPGIAPREPLQWPLAQLRHAYAQLKAIPNIEAGRLNTQQFADGLIAPVIRYLEGAAEQEIRTLREKADVLDNANIVEIAARNQSGSVAEYMNHWEGRAVNAEAREAALRSTLIALRPYVQHDRMCPRSINVRITTDEPGWVTKSEVMACNCGLDALTQAAGLPQ